VLHQIAQEGMQRAQFLKFAKDQLDHGLDWFVRLIDHRAGGVMDIARWGSPS
jgi:hypothetical protein